MDCPVCGADAEQIATTIDGMSIACPTCGKYEISNAVLCHRSVAEACTGATLPDPG